MELQIHVLMEFVSVAAMMHAAFQAKHVCQECVNAEQLLLAQGSLLDHIATQQIMFANVLRL